MDRLWHVLKYVRYIFYNISSKNAVNTAAATLHDLEDKTKFHAAVEKSIADAHVDIDGNAPSTSSIQFDVELPTYANQNYHALLLVWAYTHVPRGCAHIHVHASHGIPCMCLHGYTHVCASASGTLHSHGFKYARNHRAVSTSMSMHSNPKRAIEAMLEWGRTNGKDYARQPAKKHFEAAAARDTLLKHKLTWAHKDADRGNAEQISPGAHPLARSLRDVLKVSPPADTHAASRIPQAAVVWVWVWVM